MNLLKLFSTQKILVVGDSILDHYVYGKVHRVSPEAPVPVVLKNREEYFLGGAANVAQNITAFGAKCTLLSLMGSDVESKILLQKCLDENIEPLFIEERGRPTTKKTRVLGNRHQIVRIDVEESRDLSLGSSLKIMKIFEEQIQAHDGVIFQDYGKGLFTNSLLNHLVQICQKHDKKILVDPKEPDLFRYQGACFIKPNLAEFKAMLKLKTEDELEIHQISDYAQRALEEFDYNFFLITLSERGILLVGRDFSRHLPGINVDVSDVSGAGDTVSAVFGLGFFSSLKNPKPGLELHHIAELSNLAGSLVCRHSGAVPVDPEELQKLFEKSSFFS
jgi:rfaE bifunctional protein kinase chain/domain